MYLRAPEGSGLKRARTAAQAVGYAIPGLVLCLVMMGTSHGTGMAAVPAVWTWLMTAANLVTTYGASRNAAWAWRVGVAAQPLAILYCVLTGQPGFVPGNLVTLTIYALAARRVRADKMKERT